MHKWWSVVSLFPLFNAERTQFLSSVCYGWPPCCRWIPCPKNGGPPFWLWWCWIHSLALGSPSRTVVHGGVPREILWIWCEGSWQGWPTLFAVCLMHFVTSPLSGHTTCISFLAAHLPHALFQYTYIVSLLCAMCVHACIRAWLCARVCACCALCTMSFLPYICMPF